MAMNYSLRGKTPEPVVLHTIDGSGNYVPIIPFGASPRPVIIVDANGNPVLTVLPDPSTGSEGDVVQVDANGDYVLGPGGSVTLPLSVAEGGTGADLSSSSGVLQADGAGNISAGNIAISKVTSLQGALDAKAAASDVATNTANIATNTAAIAANTTAIAGKAAASHTHVGSDLVWPIEFGAGTVDGTKVQALKRTAGAFGNGQPTGLLNFPNAGQFAIIRNGDVTTTPYLLVSNDLFGLYGGGTAIGDGSTWGAIFVNNGTTIFPGTASFNENLTGTKQVIGKRNSVAARAGNPTTLSAGSFVAVAFDQNVRTNSLTNGVSHSTSSDTTRFVCNSTGTFRFEGVIAVSCSAAGQGYLRVFQNGYRVHTQPFKSAVGIVPVPFSYETDIAVTTTDYFEITAYIPGGSTGTAAGSGTTGNSSFASLTKVGV